MNLIGRIQKTQRRMEDEAIWLSDFMADTRIKQEYRDKVFDIYIRRKIEIRQERKERLRKRREDFLKFVEDNF